MAKICIDPGHYGKYNRSPGVPEYYESDMAWKLSLLQKKYLEKLGHTVILTRTNKDKDLDLITRGKTSNGCDLFISNHSNAVGGGMNESVSYAAVYHLVDDKTTKCDDISIEVANKIAPVIGQTMGVPFKILSRKSGNDRNKDGFLNDNYYGVLHGARLVNTPGLILEHGFHTNTKTVKWLLEDSNLNQLAKAEAECINSFFVGSVSEDINDYTKITGKSVATAAQMEAYIKSKNPKVDKKVIDMIPTYISEGNKENIRGDIAFAQSCLETGNFTFANSAVTLDQNNFCGLGVTSNGMKGNSFDTPTLGIRAQIQHLKAYANKQPLVEKCIDPRFKYVERGCAEYVEWLGIQENPNHKGWAAGSNYGSKILSILGSITKNNTNQQTTSENTSDNTHINTNTFLVRVDISDLNIRKGPGTNYSKIGKFTGKGTFTIVETKSGQGSKSGWGRLKSGLGWISLDYAKRFKR